MACIAVARSVAVPITVAGISIAIRAIITAVVTVLGPVAVESRRISRPSPAPGTPAPAPPPWKAKTANEDNVRRGKPPSTAIPPTPSAIPISQTSVPVSTTPSSAIPRPAVPCPTALNAHSGASNHSTASDHSGVPNHSTASDRSGVSNHSTASDRSGVPGHPTVPPATAVRPSRGQWSHCEGNRATQEKYQL